MRIKKADRNKRKTVWGLLHLINSSGFVKHWNAPPWSESECQRQPGQSCGGEIKPIAFSDKLYSSQSITRRTSLSKLVSVVKLL